MHVSVTLAQFQFFLFIEALAKPPASVLQVYVGGQGMRVWFIGVGVGIGIGGASTFFTILRKRRNKARSCLPANLRQWDLGWVFLTLIAENTTQPAPSPPSGRLRQRERGQGKKG